MVEMFALKVINEDSYTTYHSVLVCISFLHKILLSAILTVVFPFVGIW